MSTLDRLSLRILHLAGFQSRYVPTTDGPMHVLEAEGKGTLPTLVMLHGFGASSVQLLPVLLRLKKHVRKLVAPDLPGHGFSATPSELGVPSLSRGLFETLDAVMGERAVLFGNSMGGAAAIRYAIERPERVERLILCSPGGAAMEQHELETFRKVFHLDDHQAALQFVDKLLGRRSPLRGLYARTARKKLQAPALQRLIRSVETSDLLTPEHLERLVMPVLMVWGEADGILPRESLEFFRRHLPAHAVVDEPARVGHSPYLESPRLLTERILRFLGEPQRAT